MKPGLRLKEPFLVPAGFVYTRPNRTDTTTEVVWPRGFVIPRGKVVVYVSEEQTAVALGLTPSTCRLEFV